MDPNESLKKYTLLVACGASFLTPFMGSAVNLAIPSIGDQFNGNALLLSWVATSYLLASATFLVPFGRLADIVGRKKIFLVGITIFALSSLLCALAWSLHSLIFLRILQGFGSAMIFGTSMAILTSVFPPQQRGKVIGINVATVYTGLSLGPVLGGFLNHNLGWSSIFYLTAFIAFAVLFFAVAKLKGEWAGAKGEPFDLLGSILYSVGLVSFMYGISAIDSVVWAKYAMVIGLVILIAFIRYEMKVSHPVLHIGLFSKNITFAFSNLAALINYSATYALGFLLSMYLQVVLGYNSQTAGLILLSQPMLMALLSPFAGTISDRVDPRIVSSWGMAITTIGLFVFCFLTKTTSIWLVVINLSFLGIGFALFSSPNTNSVMGSVEKRFYGVASSTLGTMRLTGQTISMAVVTLLLTIFIGDANISAANPDLLLKGTRTAFIVFTVMCFGGIFASLARGKAGSNLQQSNR